MATEAGDADECNKHSVGQASTANHKFVGALGHTTEAKIGGLIYMKARYYDPSVGRFISEDPKQSGGNWYLYCDGNPVERVDSDGRFWILVAILASALAAGVVDRLASGTWHWQAFVLGGLTAAAGPLVFLLTECALTAGIVGAVFGAAVNMLYAMDQGGDPLSVLAAGFFGLVGGGLGAALPAEDAVDIAFGLVIGILTGDADTYGRGTWVPTVEQI